MSRIREQARYLATKPYTVVAFRDTTTDDDYIYVALNPEIEGCVAQGETMEEAQRNLDEVRIGIIEHLLEHNLPVPEPARMEVDTEDDSIELDEMRREPDKEDAVNASLQSIAAE
jgi:predicted RNase H-like HicB family nuclease